MDICNVCDTGERERERKKKKKKKKKIVSYLFDLFGWLTIVDDYDDDELLLMFLFIIIIAISSFIEFILSHSLACLYGELSFFIRSFHHHRRT